LIWSSLTIYEFSENWIWDAVRELALELPEDFPASRLALRLPLKLFIGDGRGEFDGCFRGEFTVFPLFKSLA
jgi:hypothetical protein